MTQSTHAEGCWTWGPKHYECALTRLAEAEKKLDYMHNVHRACGEALSDEMHKRKEAEQRAASAEKDAARYRYMKANCVPVMAFNTQPLDSRASPGTAYVTSGGWTDIDAAIDTALAQSKEPTV